MMKASPRRDGRSIWRGARQPEPGRVPNLCSLEWPRHLRHTPVGCASIGTRISHVGCRAHLRRSGSGHQSGSSMVGRLPEGEFPSDYVPLLRWLIFTGVTLFGFVLAWHFGLIRLMLASDPTHISAVICALY